MTDNEGDAKLQILRTPMGTLTAGDVQDAKDVADSAIAAGRLLALVHEGQVLIPAFQLDRDAGGIRPMVAAMNQARGARADPWGVASWWLSENPWLADWETPASLVTRDGEDAPLMRIVTLDGAEESMMTPAIPLSLEDARCHLAIRHVDLANLSEGERELLVIAEGLMRLLDRLAPAGTVPDGLTVDAVNPSVTTQ